MQLHDLKREHKLKTAKRVGRGGKRGKTSGRGMKGQKARTGNSMRPAMRDVIMKLPKLRGHGVHSGKNKAIINKYFPVNVSALEKAFQNGEVVSQFSLVEKGVVEKVRGRIPRIKILGNGELKKKLIVEGLSLSKTAREKIEAAKGQIK